MTSYKFGGFRIGQRIRSEDFRYHRDCFIEGVIEEVNEKPTSSQRPFAHYIVRCERDTIQEVAARPGNGAGRILACGPSRVGQMISVPMETWCDWETRVQLLSEAKS